MHPVRSPALVHPAFENPAASSGTSLHLASGRAALLQECSDVRPGARPTALAEVSVLRRVLIRPRWR